MATRQAKPAAKPGTAAKTAPAKAKTGTATGGGRRSPAPKSDLDRRWSIPLFIVGIFFTLLALVPGEALWQTIRTNVLFGGFGISGWLLGPMLIWWGVRISMEKQVVPIIIKSVLVMLALSGAALVFGKAEFLADLREKDFGGVMEALLETGRSSAFGGGILSLFLGYTMLAAFGHVVARILLVVGTAIALMVMTGVTPGDIVRFFLRMGDKAAVLLEKDDGDYPEEEPPPVGAGRGAGPVGGAAGRAKGRGGKGAPAAMAAAPARAAMPAQTRPRRMTIVDVPLGPDVEFDGDAPNAAPNGAAGRGAAVAAVPRRANPVDIDLDGGGPVSEPGLSGNLGKVDIGPGGTFGLERDFRPGGGQTGAADGFEDDDSETGLGDYVPLIPFAKSGPAMAPAPKQEAQGDILLFGEDDPYDALGGPGSKLDHSALPLDVEHIDLGGSDLPDDPDFDLFAGSGKTLPGSAVIPDSALEPLAGAGAGEAGAAGFEEARRPMSPFEQAVRAAADENFEKDLRPEEADDQPPFAVEPAVSPAAVPAATAPPQGPDFDVLRQGQAPAAPAVGAGVLPAGQPGTPVQQPGPKTSADSAEGKSAAYDPDVAVMIQKAAEAKEDVGTGRLVEENSVYHPYQKPPLSLFSRTDSARTPGAEEEMVKTADRLVGALDSFGVQTRIINVSRGPSVTRYEVQPQSGVKISRITNLSDDIALNLAAESVRIEAPIPGKPAVGIEVPNKVKSTVGIRELLESGSFEKSASPLSIALGKNIAGEVVVADLARMPHLLIAGSTGSGKSVCVNSIIMSFLYKSSPEDVRLVLIDPKIVELAEYNGIPHLLIPVVTEPRQAAKALGQMVAEMERRYHSFAENNVRDITSYNKLVMQQGDLEKMPYIAIVIDELADLMMVAGKDVETFICRIAQKARAAGMHLIVATQRPSVDVITGLIKSNIPSRIAFAVASQIDSRTILDGAGAEKLLGMGDMLFMPVGANKPTRVQGTFVKDKEITAALEFIKQTSQAEYDESVLAEMEKVVLSGSAKKNDSGDDGDEDSGDIINDATFVSAVEVALEQGSISTSFLQRRLRLGYARAGRIMDQMETLGIVSPPEGSKPRQVLITRQDWMELQMNASE